MKIICNKEEYALLVRECQCNIIEASCGGCLFAGMCNTYKEMPDAVMEYIEDICEIEG